MTTWWDVVPPLAVAVLLGIGPGLVLGAALKLRGMALWGLAPAFSVSIVAVSSVIAPVVGLRWGIIPMLGTTIVLFAVVVLFRHFWYRHHSPLVFVQDPSRLMVWWAIGLAVGALVIGIRFMVIIQAPDHISQTFDNIFHLNALRYILDDGNASSLSLGALGRGAGSFYPGAWHAFVGLTVLISGCSLPVGISAGNLVIGAVFWPLSCMLLVRQIVGARRLAIAAAGVLSAAFAVFPYLVIDFGVIYPYLLAMSVQPAALAVVIVVAGLATKQTYGGAVAWIALLGTLPGIALAHPSALMGLLALSVPIMLTVIYRGVRRLREHRASRGRFALYLGAWGAAFLVMGVLWLELRVTTLWNPRVSLAHAFGELALNAPVDLPIAWVVSALVVTGIVVVVRRRAQFWLVLCYAMAAFLFIAATGIPYSYFRNGIVGIWYSDPQRLAAQMPVIALPLAALGFTWLHDRLQGLRRNRHDATRPRPAIAVTAVLLAGLLITTQLSHVNAETAEAMKSYTLNEESALLSPDEFALLARIDTIVPRGSTIAGNPRTGASLVYAFANRRPMLPHVRGYDSPQSIIIAQRLNLANIDPTVCPAVRALGVGYVLDFGRRQVHLSVNDFPGLDNLAFSGAVTLVDQQGAAKLYKITACD